jgi:hypothetical protein
MGGIVTYGSILDDLYGPEVYSQQDIERQKRDIYPQLENAPPISNTNIQHTLRPTASTSVLRPSSSAGNISNTNPTPKPNTLLKGDRDLLTQSRQKLEENKHNIVIPLIQDQLRSTWVEKALGEGLAEDMDEISDEDGTIVIPSGSEAFTMSISIRSTKALAANIRLIKPPYFLVGQKHLSVSKIKSRSASGQEEDDGSLVLAPGKIYFYNLRMVPVDHGLVKDTLVFHFGDFVICRWVGLRFLHFVLADLVYNSLDFD